MGKKQHQKDKLEEPLIPLPMEKGHYCVSETTTTPQAALYNPPSLQQYHSNSVSVFAGHHRYLTCTEWRTLYGGKKTTSDEGKNSKFRRLPFFCCSLSLQPFEHPYCTKEGIIFDLMNIVPFLKQFGVNPVNGEKLNAKDLIKLSFYKNSDGKYHCPVTFRIFNENTHIVAIGPTGNVFSYEAVERLNIKPGFWKDLLNDVAFTRKDIITIQDPTNLDKFNLANFYHMKKGIKVIDEEEELLKKDPRYKLKNINAETKGVLEELDSTYKPEPVKVEQKKRADAVNAAHYSTGAVAAAFTSTVMSLETVHESAIRDENLLRYERLKKKTYIRMLTNKGPLNLELHSDMVPRTCENFLKLCQQGYYNNTVFHRSIRNFMIQGGDPMGTGKGGQSAWGEPFKDEFKPNLTHSGRGVLSMANTGPNTNKSQLSARHLDGKHTVFGKVVGGLDTLHKLEYVETDKNDKPKLVNERADAEAKTEEAKQKTKIQKVKKTEDTGPKVFKQGVGKYINLKAQKRTFDDEDLSETQKKKTTKQFKMQLKNFDAW
ncbi:hypothetical protein LSH36_3g17078 [Paralvinella palmiformis]|uniref:RING-type E3 ubiquitin-protein ligase PPIL2 n=1 Tax=Paralvinella palmiformis TaxID=53620 RepID=A0AAD9NJ95_9ANNE|nr:hypothetical protein LSH36_3g17078 [Paralvinella palmiformis]